MSFTKFTSDISNIDLPKKFTFPFYYTPHQLSILAAQELQDYLTTQNDWIHNFGLIEGQEGLVIGKMFGVLVVKHKTEGLGYLSAFSGKLANSNDHKRFVPPIFDLLEENSFFRREEIIVNDFTIKIAELENSDTHLNLINNFNENKNRIDKQIEELRSLVKSKKAERKLQRELAKDLPKQEYDILEAELVKASLHYHFILKDAIQKGKEELSSFENALKEFENKIANLKEERKNMSNDLQNRIFKEYFFLNSKLEKKSIFDIFGENPPAGTGECAAPKLLQYAYLNDLEPIAMAEFWWGASPKSEVRKHKYFYPACRNKCEPVLGFQLIGLDVEDNVILKNLSENKEIEFVYEDEDIIVINKPAELLSIPGKNISDSVMTRIQNLYPNITSPIIVHRLDMSTSGIMLIAKNKEAHYYLQEQFENRTIKKRYVALLDGTFKDDEGVISLPLRTDFDNRPFQIVCYKHGKHAVTEWKVLERKDNKTKIQFYPITGRTHQLRVHSAHVNGLNCSIVGDDLYGKKGDRLCLHAQYIRFEHPRTKEIMEITVPEEF